MLEEKSTFERFVERYAEGTVPWDDAQPPPEIVELAQRLPTGRAVDLGCGFGRTAIYLAGLGWEVDGVDFVPQAIEEARRRALAAGVSDRARFTIASAADIPFLKPPYDLAVDVGCMHSFGEDDLLSYRNELRRLLPTGATYVLFAHLRDAEDPPGDGPRGIPEESILALLESDFVLERIERGITQVEDRPPWKSGWLWFRRR